MIFPRMPVLFITRDYSLKHTMKAMKIQMKSNCSNSRSVQDIDSIYIDQTGTYWKKAEVYDYLKQFPKSIQTSVYKGYKQDKIEMRGDRAEMSDFPLYLNTVAGGLDRRDQTIGGFSFVVKIYAVPVVEIIG